MTVIPESRFTVHPEWVDYNGHMNMGFYLVAFDEVGTDPFFDWLDIGEDYRRRTNRSMFTLAANVDYLSEMFEGDAGRIVTRLIDRDHKRLHFFHTMYGPEDEVVATNELLAIHVDMESRRSVPFDDDLQARLGELATTHRSGGRHERVGRVLGIRR